MTFWTCLAAVCVAGLTVVGGVRTLGVASEPGGVVIGVQAESPQKSIRGGRNAQEMRKERGKSAGGQPRRGSTVALAPSEGVLQFEKLRHDFGKVGAGEEVHTTFPFVNTGSEKLIIDRIRASCGCTVPTLEKTEYEPGESGEIEVAFKPRGTSKSSKTITVMSNARGQERQLLTVSAETVEIVRATPALVQFGQALKGEARSVLVAMDSIDPDFKVLGVEVEPEGLVSVEVVDKEAGVPSPEHMPGRQVLEVTLHSEAPVGRLLRRLHVTMLAAMEGESAKERLMTINAHGNVVGDLQATPAAIRVPTVVSGETFEGSAIVSLRSGKDFSVETVEVERSNIPGVKAWVEAYDDGKTQGHRVFVSGDTTDFRGVFRGFVKVTTDVSDEDPLMISFSGAARQGAAGRSEARLR